MITYKRKISCQFHFSLRVKQHPDLDKPQKNEQTTWKTQKKKLVNFPSE